MTAPTKEIAVLMGGWSAEREVSLTSGRAVATALREAGHAVREVVVERDLPRLLDDLTPLPALVFNALHGQGGEDGRIQAVLDILGLPYTHSGHLASAVAMDKQLTKLILAQAGINCPEGKLVPLEELRAQHPLPPPYVVKPNAEGSSVGVAIVTGQENRLPALLEDWPYADPVLVEAFVPGRELTVAAMGRSGEAPRAMAVTEIVPAAGFYDYRAKYTEGGSAHMLPAEVPELVAAKARQWAVEAHRALGCDGITRSDFRWDPSQPGTDGLYFLEINTQPGLTPLSLVPEQAAHIGMDFTGLAEWMVEAARCHG